VSPQRVDQADVTWPPERFYWALVENAPWRGTGPLPPGLLSLAEDELPVSADELHAVGIPVDSGVLVCAVPKDHLAAIDDSVLSLRPSTTPAGVQADCTQLNLLVGDCEPRRLRRARLGRHAVGATTLLLCGLLVSTGLARRAAHWAHDAELAEKAWTTSATAQAPAAAPATVVMDLQRIAGRLESAAAVEPPADAALMLASLLEHWPAQVASKPQSITVRVGTVTVSVLVADAPAFLTAIEPPEGWTMDQPMLNIAGDLTRLSLTFHSGGEHMKEGI
jgi:hypothetical protein